MIWPVAYQNRVQQEWGCWDTTKLNAGRKKAWSRRHRVAPWETDAGDGTLPNKPQSCGNTQINGDELV